MDKKTKKAVINFTRVQTFGEVDMHCIKINVNFANPSLFEIQELIVPENK
jgi:hypothetical protein